MKKHIVVSSYCIAMLMLVNSSNAQLIQGSCVQTLNNPDGTEGVANQNPTACQEYMGVCSGSCTGYQPATGLVCATCATFVNEAQNLTGKSCTPGTDPYAATKVRASCTGWAACGCGSNWTAVTPPSSTTIYCGATGNDC